MGVDAGIIEALRLGQPPSFSREDEQVAYLVATQLLSDKRLSDQTFAAAKSLFGEEQLVELTLTIGYYALATIAVNAFEVELLDSMVDPFPEWP